MPTRKLAHSIAGLLVASIVSMPSAARSELLSEEICRDSICKFDIRCSSSDDDFERLKEKCKEAGKPFFWLPHNHLNSKERPSLRAEISLNTIKGQAHSCVSIVSCSLNSSPPDYSLIERGPGDKALANYQKYCKELDKLIAWTHRQNCR